MVAAHFGHHASQRDRVDVGYAVHTSTGRHRFRLARDGAQATKVVDVGDLLYRLDRDLTVRAQEARPDLYFLHAAALEWGGRALLLVAPSGGGKSTTTWALSHHGFSYLSDELGPVDLRTLEVHPFPRTLSLKTNPPAPYPRPRSARRTSAGVHISPTDLPGGVAKGPCPLAAVFLLTRARRGAVSSIRPVGRAEALTRLYGNALNPLAHPGEGLDGAERIATDASVVELCTADLAASCRLIGAALAGRAGG